MLYTVKETAGLAGVTIKTLHHYHKLGLLVPRETSEAGYRLYGKEELERLQEILIYRELELPLGRIKELLDGKGDRAAILAEQEGLLLARQQRLEAILSTLRASLASVNAGISQEPQELFRGFATEEEWREALREQSEHLQEMYGFDLLESEPAIDVPAMNEQAAEAAAFLADMARSLREGISHDDVEVRERLRRHLQALAGYGQAFSPAELAGQTRFFLQDSFHRQMLEDQQTGLAYYLAAAAAAFAESEESSENRD
ncbi:MerR family transcriptional regulator [Paenibacillus sp. J31TS4]|uniref:MerR family transcriptional regulator n=1 Tax=Paenibacillus sp. J31TS4 TaxID=2807195 RepID=UPI001B088B52|nr:MerR family transcriptional regulator [Paenibacillus sp. J31TS4]GIP38154.1 MerR family transcriptional regulator [Paenibacillus sp. J31TS4]